MKPLSFSFHCVINAFLLYSAVHEIDIEIPCPTRIPTPYGGRLVWICPGGNKIIAHLKDKVKIRHKKRWSQVMQQITKRCGEVNIMLINKNNRGRSCICCSTCIRTFRNLPGYFQDETGTHIHTFRHITSNRLKVATTNDNEGNVCEVKRIWLGYRGYYITVDILWEGSRLPLINKVKCRSGVFKSSLYSAITSGLRKIPLLCISSWCRTLLQTRQKVWEATQDCWHAK